MKTFSFLFILLASFSLSLTATAQNFFSDTQAFLSNCVEDGRVDYASLADDPAQLNSLTRQIASYQLKGDRSDFPFYLNAYNVMVIKSVVDAYPISSPMDVDGFFDKNTFSVAGKEMTLNDIENKIIRPVYNDARIHFALVCGAIGCPVLAGEAFTVENVNDLLNARTKKAMNDNFFIRVDEKKSTVFISKIFEWYQGDFGADKAAVLEYINQYRNHAIPASYTVDYYEYDWTLNAKK